MLLLCAASLGHLPPASYAELLAATPHDIVRIDPSDTTPPRLSFTAHHLDLHIDLDQRHNALFATNAEHFVVTPTNAVASRDALDGGDIHRGAVFAHGQRIGDALLTLRDGRVEGHLSANGTALYVTHHHDDLHAVFEQREWGKAMGAENWGCSVTGSDHAHANHNEHALVADHRRRLLEGAEVKHIELVIVNDFARCAAFTAAGGSNPLGAMMTRSAAIVATANILFHNGFTTTAIDPNAGPSPVALEYDVKITIVAMISFAYGDPYNATNASVTGKGAPSEVDVDLLHAAFQTWTSDGNLDAANGAKGILATVPSYDVMHLLSGLDFSGFSVGHASLHGMCTAASSVSISMAPIASTDAHSATSVAHQFGHLLGMRHTSVVDSVVGVVNFCNGDGVEHIMDENANWAGIPTAEVWSSCSRKWLTSYMETRYGKTAAYPMCMEALADPSVVWDPAVSIGVCGDGVRQPGEECDCGARHCETVDPCCNGVTCMLHPGAVCSLLDACCQRGGPPNAASVCTFKPSTAVCREAVPPCDPAERCDGTSAMCPLDSVSSTGDACVAVDASGASGTCYGGSCFSHDAQCWATKKLGFATLSGGECSFRGDADGTAACGSLACQKTADAGGSCSIPKLSFVMGQPAAPIPVKDGTPCESGKVCISQVCTLISSLPTNAPTFAQTKAPTPVGQTYAPSKAPSPRPPSTKAPTVVGQTYTPTSVPTAAPGVVAAVTTSDSDSTAASAVASVLISLFLVCFIIVVLLAISAIIIIVLVMRARKRDKEFEKDAVSRTGDFVEPGGDVGGGAKKSIGQALRPNSLVVGANPIRVAAKQTSIDGVGIEMSTVGGDSFSVGLGGWDGLGMPPTDSGRDPTDSFLRPISLLRPESRAFKQPPQVPLEARVLLSPSIVFHETTQPTAPPAIVLEEAPIVRTIWGAPLARGSSAPAIGSGGETPSAGLTQGHSLPRMHGGGGGGPPPAFTPAFTASAPTPPRVASIPPDQVPPAVGFRALAAARMEKNRKAKAEEPAPPPFSPPPPRKTDAGQHIRAAKVTTVVVTSEKQTAVEVVLEEAPLALTIVQTVSVPLRRGSSAPAIRSGGKVSSPVVKQGKSLPRMEAGRMQQEAAPSPPPHPPAALPSTEVMIKHSPASETPHI